MILPRPLLLSFETCLLGGLHLERLTARAISPISSLRSSPGKTTSKWPDARFRMAANRIVSMKV
jgi:hypothetical protein